MAICLIIGTDFLMEAKADPGAKKTPAHVRTDQELDAYLKTISAEERPGAICDEMASRFHDGVKAAEACAARIKKLNDKSITSVSANGEQVFVTRINSKGVEELEQFDVFPDGDKTL